MGRRDGVAFVRSVPGPHRPVLGQQSRHMPPGPTEGTVLTDQPSETYKQGWRQLGAGWGPEKHFGSCQTPSRDKGGQSRAHIHVHGPAHTHLSKVKRTATRASARGRAASMSRGWAYTRPCWSSRSAHELLGGSQNLSCQNHSLMLDHILGTHCSQGRAQPTAWVQKGTPTPPLTPSAYSLQFFIACQGQT